MRPAAQRRTPESLRAEHSVVYRDPFAYCSHPSMLRLASGEWLIAFMESMRRAEVLHSPADPRFYNVLTRSADRGRCPGAGGVWGLIHPTGQIRLRRRRRVPRLVRAAR